MQRPFRTHIPIFLCICLLPISCSREEPDHSAIPSPPPSGDEISHERITLLYEHPDCRIDEEPCVELRFRFPDFLERGPLADSLEAWISKKIEGPDGTGITLDEFAREWFADYDQYARHIEGYNLAWKLERRVELIHETSNLVTLHFHEFSYTGGAHPVQVDQFRSFYKPDGTMLTIGDLTAGRREFEILRDLAEEQFRYTYQLLENDDLADAGFHFLDGEFHLTENFAFTRYGLLFYFNAYEVAPYSTGPIAIELPYEDLDYLVRPLWLPGTNQRTL